MFLLLFISGVVGSVGVVFWSDLRRDVSGQCLAAALVTGQAMSSRRQVTMAAAAGCSY